VLLGLVFVCLLGFSILYVFCFSQGTILFALIVLDLVSSVLRQEIGWENVFKMTKFVSSGT